MEIKTMRYVKPEYYDDFVCAASRCPQTCCAGWQIVIDEESMARYEAVIRQNRDNFSGRLEASIDWQEGVFFQKNKRCAFLNETNLCDLYARLGAKALCNTCRDYPRHIEEFEGLRELSLSLSCPVAAERILSEKKFPVFVEYETQEPEELEEEFEDFDLLLFTQLEDARKVAFTILQAPHLTFRQQISYLLSLAAKMDDCVGEGRFSDMDEVIAGYACPTEPAEGTVFDWYGKKRFDTFKENFAALEKMELLSEEWEEERNCAKHFLYEQGEAQYLQIAERFEKQMEVSGIEGISLKQMAVNLLVSFVYTWFCGAVYNGWVYSKMAMAVYCTCYILEFMMASWIEKKEHLSLSDCVEITCHFTREVEHSDYNLGILEEWFIQTLQDAPEEF